MHPLFVKIIIISFLLTFLQCKKSEKKNQEQLESHPLAFYNFNKNDTAFKNLDISKDSAIIKILHNYYNYFWKGNNLSGGIIVVRDNKILLEKYLGYERTENNKIITQNSPIHLASISKNLTAMVILKLVEKGKIKLNQKANTILTQFPYPDITVFDLLTHRSGLGNYASYAENPNWYNFENDFTNQNMYQMFAKYKPVPFALPNKSFSYSNTNYAFLALIIEKITGMKYPKAMQELLFKPLGMENTYVFEKKDFKTTSFSYYNNGKKVDWDRFDLIYGDKNIYSTPRDLQLYSKAMFSQKFLRKSLMDSAIMGYSNERKGTKNYGFGFRLLQFDNGKKISFHNGWWHGNYTVFVHLIDEKVTIIALGNKKNRAVYSAFSLVSLFGDYPLELENKEELLEEKDQNNTDSLEILIKEIKDFEKQNKYHKKDSVLKKNTPKQNPNQTSKDSVLKNVDLLIFK